MRQSHQLLFLIQEIRIISFGNMLARICEQTPDADAAVVSSAIGMDSRIGAKYLRGAVSYGGPCFPRDNVAFSLVAQRAGTRAPLAEATHQFNQWQITWLKQLVLSHLRPGRQVGVLGLTYKPNTDVCDASAGLLLCKELCAAKIPVTAYDPAGMTNARRDLGETVRYVSSLTRIASDSDVLVITTPWNEFKALSPSHLKSGGAKPTIIDCWRMLDSQKFHDTANIIAAGLGPHA